MPLSQPCPPSFEVSAETHWYFRLVLLSLHIHLYRGSRQLSLYTIRSMAEQPTIVKQAEDAVSQIAASVAETLNFGDKEVVGNPGKLVAPSTDPS